MPWRRMGKWVQIYIYYTYLCREEEDAVVEEGWMGRDGCVRCRWVEIGISDVDG